MLSPYQCEPYVNFADTEPRNKMLAALKQVKGKLGQSYPLRIAGKEISTPQTIQSVSPANPDLLIGKVAKATTDHAEQAIAAATKAFGTWSRVPGQVRARYLVKAAAIMRRRLYELTAWECYEASKSWIEGYADVCEAIDFLEFYARQMTRLDGPHPVTPFPGEENEVRYIPLGVGVIIPPWNFPLAICIGMTSAAIVTGNTVVLKPASTTPVVAAIFAEIMAETSLPDGVINFLPGPGSAIGDTLVSHPKTRFIAFTGSVEVGLGIFEKAAKVHPTQIWLKRTVMEMGGKDCIVVDETADLDDAADGVVAAAFGFQGQKCSACSRLIAHHAIHDTLIEKIGQRTRKITIGDTTGTENFFMGAVIDPAAHNKINEYIEIGRTEGRVVLADGKVPAKGYFVPPTIIADVDRNARIAQEEIFGPVLAVIQGRNFDDLLDIANGTRYGLTGALYSRDRSRLERARHELHVGNLYLNRKCTGALVDVQPFGGFNMSGTDSKAGGRDYLQLFLQAKTICEQW